MHRFGPVGYNPKNNRVLDALKKGQVKLLGFPAFAYGSRDRVRATEVFCTEQKPFFVSRGADSYAVFVPELMSSDELAAFKTSVALQGLKLAAFVARKEKSGWDYDPGSGGG